MTGFYRTGLMLVTGLLLIMTMGIPVPGEPSHHGHDHGHDHGLERGVLECGEVPALLTIATASTSGYADC